jgi:Transglycosylase SLT domain
MLRAEKASCLHVLAARPMTLPRLIRAKLLLLAPLLVAAASPAGADDLCGDLARAAERREGIPSGLVQAVALAESGRWLAGMRQGRAWPWTVTSFDESYYLESKEAAIEKVRELKARGRSNIDVGCMQVNLGHHGHAFASLEQALDPAANVAYGAGFLRRLHTETRSWSSATAQYHTRDPARGEAYRAKVFRLWQGVSPGMQAIETVQLAGARQPEGEMPEGPRIVRFGADHGSGRAAADAIPVLRGR